MQILTVPNPLLNAVAVEVIDFSTMKETYEQMASVADNAELVGLASTQVGRVGRFFIARTTESVDYIMFINPKIKGDKSKGRSFRWEGCGSIPNTVCLVERFNTVTITAYDVNGYDFIMTLSGAGARMVQHETDHLNGVLITSKARQRKTV